MERGVAKKKQQLASRLLLPLSLSPRNMNAPLLLKITMEWSRVSFFSFSFFSGRLLPAFLPAVTIGGKIWPPKPGVCAPRLDAFYYQPNPRNVSSMGKAVLLSLPLPT